MRKSIVLLATICLSLNICLAQYYSTPIKTGNPNNKNSEDLEYPVGGGLPNTWTEIHAGNVVNPVWTSVQTIPFPFMFNGNVVTSYKISTSGVLTFTTTATAVPTSLNANLPNANIPNNSICIWGISAKGSNDKIVTKTFGTAPNRQIWVMFNDYSLPTIFTSHYTYWSIVLEESTNNIYIVDQRSTPALAMALTLGIQISSTQAIQSKNASGGNTISSTSTNDPSRADNSYRTFIQGAQPFRDLKGESILMEPIIAVNRGPFPIKLVVQNLGKDTVASLDLNYLNTSSLKTSATLTNLNILPWQLDTLTHPLLWAPSAGTTILKVWADNINGDTDQNPNNDSAFHQVSIIPQSAVRVPFLESFTSSTSVPSAAFNAQIESTLALESQEVLHLKYPMNWPGTGDPYFTNEGGTRRQLYGITILPNLQVDGNDWSKNNITLDTSNISLALNKLTLVNLDAGFYISGKKVCADITIDPLVDITNSNLSLYIAIYEKESVNNTKSSGEAKFYNIMKKMMPDASGTSIPSLTQGVANNKSFCFTFNGSYILPPNGNSPVDLSSYHTIEDFSNLGVIAWLQDKVTKEVFQATQAYSTIGVDENMANQNQPQIFPNPASEQLFIKTNSNKLQNTQVSLLSITGQTLVNQDFEGVSGNDILALNLPKLSAGIYIVNVRIGDLLTSEKIIIQ